MWEPEHRFVWHLCKMYRTTPDDSRITDMDPVQKLWMYENWLADQHDQGELAKTHACLLASFWKPEAAKEVLGYGGNVHTSTDEEFEESCRIVKESAQKEQINSNNKRRRRRIVKG